MERGQLIVSCDFGTSEFRVLVVSYDEAGLRAVGCGAAEAIGFRDGDFVDFTSATRALKRAMEQAEASANVDISGFYYSVTGSHLRSVWARCQQQLNPPRRPITGEDVETVVEKAHGIAIPFDHAILVANPVGFTVDGIGGIIDPVGRTGSTLESDVHLITGSSTVLQNVESTIVNAQCDPVGWSIDVLATASVLLRRDERERGVALVDVGADSTQWVLFRNDEIAGCGLVPWGGRIMTRDLAHGLRCSEPEAEETKHKRGVVLRSLVEEVDPEVLFEEEAPAESPGLIAAILEPRLEEILALVKKDMGQALSQGDLLGGVVLTGGGCRCRGSDDLAEQVFQLPVEIRQDAEGVAGLDRLPDHRWTTAAGLALWAAGGDDEMPDPGTEEGDGLGGIVRRIFRRKK